MTPSLHNSAFIDTHFHAGADLYVRAHSVAKAGLLYADRQGWVVVKSHLGSTAAQAWEARQNGGAVSGSVVLNAIAGGLSLRAVEQAVWQHGSDVEVRLIVYLPTLRGEPLRRSALRRVPALPSGPRDAFRAESLCTETGVLRPEVRDLVRAARDLPVVLATGHANRDELFRLVDLAVAMGLSRLLLTHPGHPCCGLSANELGALSDETNIYTEVTALERLLGHHDAEGYARLLTSSPRVIHSSDLGQPDQTDIRGWLRLRDAWFDEAGLGQEVRQRITLANARELLSF